MNFIFALVLFESGLSRSFVPLALSITFRVLNSPMLVDITNDRLVGASNVFKGYTFDIYC